MLLLFSKVKEIMYSFFMSHFGPLRLRLRFHIHIFSIISSLLEGAIQSLENIDALGHCSSVIVITMVVDAGNQYIHINILSKLPEIDTARVYKACSSLNPHV